MEEEPQLVKCHKCNTAQPIGKDGDFLYHDPCYPKPPAKEGETPDPSKRQTGKPEVYAYTIKDATFGEFKVLNTANGWWQDPGKVQRLIDAYKIDANDDEACAYAGVRVTNLEYFKELHPDFSGVKRACYQALGLKAKNALAAKVDKEPEWYLERKRKDEYAPRQELTGAEGEALIEQKNRLTELHEKVYGAVPNNENGNTENQSSPGTAPGGDTKPEAAA